MWVFLILVAGLLTAAVVLAVELRKLNVFARFARAWRVLKDVPEEEPAPLEIVRLTPEPAPVAVPPRSERWCSGGVPEWAPMMRCQPRRRRSRPTPLLSDVVPRRSPILPQPAPKSVPPSGLYLASRPGVLVDPAAYQLAPPLPLDPSEVTLQDLSTSMGPASVDIDLEDLEDLVDTRPSQALTAAEAEEILARADELELPTSDAWSQPAWVGEERRSANERITEPQLTASLSDIPQDPPTGRGILPQEDQLAG